MAKVNQPSNDVAEIKKMIEKLSFLIGNQQDASKELVAVNRELLKTMALLQSGFATNQEDAQRLIVAVGDGLEVTDEYATKWAKQRKATKEDVDDLISKFRQIEKIDIEKIDNAEDYIDLLREQYDLLDDSADISKQLLGSHEQIVKVIRDNKLQTGGLSAALQNTDDVLQKIVKRKLDFSGLMSDVSAPIAKITGTIDDLKSDIEAISSNLSGNMFNVDLKFNPISNKLDEEIKTSLDGIQLEKTARSEALDEFFTKNTKLQNNLARRMAAMSFNPSIQYDVDTAEIKTVNGILNKGTEEYGQVLSQLDDIIKNSNIGEQLQSSFKEVVKLLELGVDRTDEQMSRYNQLVGSMDLGTKILLEQVAIRNDDLNVLKSGIELEKNKYDMLLRYSNKLGAAEKIVQQIADGFDYINMVLPKGVGSALGLDKVSLNLLDAHKRGVQDFVSELGKGSDPAAAMSKYMENLGPAIRSALTPTTLLVAGAFALFKFTEMITDKYKQMQSEMKLSLLQSKQLLETQLGILTSQKNQFMTMKDISEIQAAMIGSDGKVFNLTTKQSKELVMNLNDLGAAFGYGNEQAVQMHKLFNRLGADDKLSVELQKSVGLMSEMAGLSPQIVSSDMIDAAEELSIYFAGVPDKAARAAIEVRKMGMSLKQAGQIAKQMLDIEGFMTDMYELNAMSNKTIDFSKAFDLGITGDIEGMTREIMNNIGTTAEYNRLDYFTRMKLAKTMGMSVEDLSKSVLMHEKMANMSEEEGKFLQENQDRIGDISKMSIEDIRNRRKQLQSTDRLAVAWDKIKGVFTAALLPAVEIFADLIDAISPFIDVIIFGLKFVGVILKALMPILKGMVLPFKWIGNAIEIVTSLLDEWFGGMSGIKTATDGIGKAMTVVGAILGTLLIPKVFIGGFSFLISSFKWIFGFLPGMSSVFGSLFKGIGNSAKESGDIMKKALSIEPKIDMSKLDEIKPKVLPPEIPKINPPTVEIPSEVKSPIVPKINPPTVEIPTNVKQPILPKITPPHLEITPTVNRPIIPKIDPISVTVTPKVQSPEIPRFTVPNPTIVPSINMKPMEVSAKETMDKVETMVSERSKRMQKGIETAVQPTAKTIDAVKTDKKKDKGSEVTKQISKAAAAGAVVAGNGWIDGMLDMGLAGISAMDGTKTAGIGAIQEFGAFAKPFISNLLKQNLEKMFNVVSDFKFGKLGENLKGTFSKVFSSASQNKSVGKITQTIEDNLGKLKVKNLLPKIFGKTETITDSITKNVDVIEKVNDAVDRTKNIVSPIEKVVDSKKVLDQVTEPLKSVKPELPKTENMSSWVDKVKDIFSKGFKAISDIIKTVWGSLRSILTEIVDFVVDVAKRIGAGIGEIIQNLLSSIAKGLNQFTTSSIKGAASLLIVSGALWVFGKAIKQFADIEWETLGKAGVAMGGLVIAAKLLSKATAEMLIGAIGIAAIGVALIPAAYAFKMFNDVDWSALAKATVAILGLAVIGSVLSSITPLMLLGAVGIAALGAALIPTAIALKMFNDVKWDGIKMAIVAMSGLGAIGAILGTVSPLLIAGSVAVAVLSGSLALLGYAIKSISDNVRDIKVDGLVNLKTQLIDLSSISVLDILKLSGALFTLNATLGMMTITSVLSSPIKLFGGVFEDVKEFIGLADKFDIVTAKILGLVDSFTILNEAISEINVDGLDKLVQPVKDVTVDISKNVNSFDDLTSKQLSQQSARPLPPTKKSTAQDVKINPPTKESVAQDVKINPFTESKKNTEKPQTNVFRPSDDVDDQSTFDTKRIEQLLSQLIRLTETAVGRPVEVNLGMNNLRTMNTVMRGFNNN